MQRDGGAETFGQISLWTQHDQEADGGRQTERERGTERERYREGEIEREWVWPWPCLDIVVPVSTDQPLFVIVCRLWESVTVAAKKSSSHFICLIGQKDAQWPRPSTRTRREVTAGCQHADWLDLQHQKYHWIMLLAVWFGRKCTFMLMLGWLIESKYFFKI